MKYVFNLLKPTKEFEPNWWALKWKPIKNGTWNFYISKYPSKKIAFKIRDSSAHNGWGRSWDGFSIELYLWYGIINFWLHYNFQCMKDGATDQSPREPLNFDL